jgi:hypothetical protein
MAVYSVISITIWVFYKPMPGSIRINKNRIATKTNKKGDTPIPKFSPPIKKRLASMPLN